MIMFFALFSVIVLFYTKNDIKKYIKYRKFPKYNVIFYYKYVCNEVKPKYFWKATSKKRGHSMICTNFDSLKEAFISFQIESKKENIIRYKIKIEHPELHI